MVSRSVLFGLQENGPFAFKVDVGKVENAEVLDERRLSLQRDSRFEQDAFRWDPERACSR